MILMIPNYMLYLAPLYLEKVQIYQIKVEGGLDFAAGWKAYRTPADW